MENATQISCIRVGAATPNRIPLRVKKDCPHRQWLCGQRHIDHSPPRQSRLSVNFSFIKNFRFKKPTFPFSLSFIPASPSSQIALSLPKSTSQKNEPGQYCLSQDKHPPDCLAAQLQPRYYGPLKVLFSPQVELQKPQVHAFCL